VALKKRVWVSALTDFLVACRWRCSSLRIAAWSWWARRRARRDLRLMRIAWIVVGSIFLYNVACETGSST
jgi:hypothetical protein